MELVGVFGGTFDPIHFGHLRTLEQVQKQLGLRAIYFVPAAQPPHRGAPTALPRQRFEMVRLAVATHASFLADDRELNRAGPSYTVDTLRSFRAELGEARPLALILGLDAFLGLPGWHDWEAVLGLAHLLVMQRPGWSLPGSLPGWWKAARCEAVEYLDDYPSGLIHMVAVRPVDVSATEIRRRLRAGESIAGQVPAAVASYIQDHGLYQ